MTTDAYENNDGGEPVSVAEIAAALDAEMQSLESLVAVSRDELAAHLHVEAELVPDIPAPMSTRTLREMARKSAVKVLAGARLRRTVEAMRRSREDISELNDRISQYNEQIDNLGLWGNLLHFKEHRQRASELEARRERKLSALKRARGSMGDLLNWIKHPRQAAKLAEAEREIFERSVGKRNQYKLALLRYRLLREELNYRAHIRELLTALPDDLAVPVRSHDLDAAIGDGELEEAIRAAMITRDTP